MNKARAQLQGVATKNMGEFLLPSGANKRSVPPSYHHQLLPINLQLSLELPGHLAMSRTVCVLTETGVTELNSEAPENTFLEGRFQGISANSLSLAVWGSRYSSHGQLLLTGKEWYKK